MFVCGDGSGYRARQATNLPNSTWIASEDRFISTGPFNANSSRHSHLSVGEEQELPHKSTSITRHNLVHNCIHHWQRFRVGTIDFFIEVRNGSSSERPWPSQHVITDLHFFLKEELNDVHRTISMETKTLYFAHDIKFTCSFKIWSPKSCACCNCITFK